MSRRRATASTPGAARLAALLLAIGQLACGAAGKRFAYEGMGRDDWQQPERVIASLSLQPGDRVADLGAGSGYFTFRLADAVGPSGRVYAVDVDPDMTSYLEQRAREEGRQNVRVVLAESDDPGLPDGGIDLVFTSNTYHHLSDHQAYFRRLQQDLAPGGRVAVLELSGHSWFSRLFGHHTPAEAIASQLGDAGYGRVASFDFLERQSFQIFAPRSD